VPALKIYYIDGENIGTNILNEMKLTAHDRVFIFTNTASHKTGYANPLFNIISGYPSGKNQADFHLIAHLAKVLAYLTRTEKSVIELVLHSKDIQLWRAFEFQCELAEIKSSNPYIGPAVAQTKPISSPLPVPSPSAGASSNNVVVPLDTSLETKILKFIAKPRTFTEIAGQMKVSQSVMTTTFNQLIKEGKVQRQSASKKHWVCVVNKSLVGQK
jgi:hypothetical protein